MNRLLSLLFLLLGLCLTSRVVAQPAFSLKRYEVKEGFSSSAIIADVTQDRDHRLWIVHLAGLLSYDGDQFKKYRASNVNRGITLRLLEKSNGDKLLLDHFNQLFFVEGDSLRAHPLNDTLKSMGQGQFCSDAYFDREDRLHIALLGKKYLIIDEDQRISEPLAEKGLDFNGFACFLREDRLPFLVKGWTNDAPHHFYLYDSTGHLLMEQPLGPFTETYPNALVQLRNGHYLLSTGRGPLVEFSPEGYFEELPRDTAILDLLVDRTGGLWVSTGLGIHYYRDGAYRPEDRRVLWPELFALAFCEDFQGGIWVYTPTKGLHQVRFPHIDHYDQANGLAPPRLQAIEVVGDRLYGGEIGERIYWLDLKTHQRDSIDVPADPGKGLIELHHDRFFDRLWITQRGEVWYRDGDRWHLHSVSQQVGRLSSKHYLSGIARDDSLVIGFVDNRYYFLRDTSLVFASEEFSAPLREVLKLGDSTLIATDNGLFLDQGSVTQPLSARDPRLGELVHSWKWFRGSVWMALMGKGLYRLSAEGLEAVRYQGKIIEGAYLMAPNGHDLWLASPGSWYRIRFEAGDSYRVEDFGSRPHGGMSVRAETKEGVWFGGLTGGLNFARYADLEQYPARPPAFSLTGLSVNGLPRALTGSHHFSHDENFLSVEYVGLNYGPGRVGFRYRIHGLRTSWTETEERSLQLLGLPPGDYRLEMQARIGEQMWSPSQHLSFRIAKPYWKTTWFLVLMGLAGGTLLYLIVRGRIRRGQRERSLLLERLNAVQRSLRAKMDPHLVFNVLSSLQYLIATRQNERAGHFLDKFSVLLRHTLDQSSVEMVSLGDELRFLEDYLELEQLRLEDKFDFSIEVGPGLDLALELPGLLVQPLVENAIHHGLKNKAGRGAVQIGFCRVDNGLRVVVEDDGVGYQRTQAAKAGQRTQRASHGMATVEERLRLHNGRGATEALRVEDLGPEGTGTRVEIFIKLKV